MSDIIGDVELNGSKGGNNEEGGCLTLMLLCVLSVFMFHYKCSTKEVVKDVTKAAKEYVEIVDSVWNEK